MGCGDAPSHAEVAPAARGWSGGAKCHDLFTREPPRTYPFSHLSALRPSAVVYASSDEPSDDVMNPRTLSGSGSVTWSVSTRTALRLAPCHASLLVSDAQSLSDTTRRHQWSAEHTASVVISWCHHVISGPLSAVRRSSAAHNCMYQQCLPLHPHPHTATQPHTATHSHTQPQRPEPLRASHRQIQSSLHIAPARTHAPPGESAQASGTSPLIFRTGRDHL